MPRPEHRPLDPRRRHRAPGRLLQVGRARDGGGVRAPVRGGAARARLHGSPAAAPDPRGHLRGRVLAPARGVAPHRAPDPLGPGRHRRGLAHHGQDRRPGHAAGARRDADRHPGGERVALRAAGDCRAQGNPRRGDGARCLVVLRPLRPGRRRDDHDHERRGGDPDRLPAVDAPSPRRVHRHRGLVLPHRQRHQGAVQRQSRADHRALPAARRGARGGRGGGFDRGRPDGPTGFPRRRS